MKKSICFLVLSSLVFSCSLFYNPKKDPLEQAGEVWVSAYLASWKHRVTGSVDGKTWGNMVTENIDWDAFTHLFYFSLVPSSNGTLSPIEDYENVNPDRLTSIIEMAHQNDKPILITIGGFNTRDAFVAAYADSTRSRFIQNIVSVVTEWGFDGVDINIHPLQSEDEEAFVRFINALYSELGKYSTPMFDRPMLTASATAQPRIYARLQGKFNQINLATYNMSRPFPGWVTWHNTPLFDGGNTFPIAGNIPLPSINTELYRFIDAGINRRKLGIGFSFYGFEWTGVSVPLQGWDPDSPPNIPFFGATPYHDLDEKYDLENALWDNDARVPYVSINNPATFVSFDNEESIKAKMTYIRREGIGGALIWELAGGFRESAEAEQQDILLKAVKRELYRD